MMDILKRIDFVQQFANEYADGSWSIDTEKWRHHVTPELIEDIRQYIVSLQLKLMHEQTAQANPFTYLWEADGTCEAVKGHVTTSSNCGPAHGWKITPLYTAPTQPVQESRMCLTCRTWREYCKCPVVHLTATQPVQEPVNEWKEAMLNGLAEHCIDAPIDMPPREILAKIIDVAILFEDPLVKGNTPYDEGTSTIDDDELLPEGYIAGLAEKLCAAPVQPVQSPPLSSIIWPKERDVGRYGDMSPHAHIRVGFDSDNDVYVSIWDEKDGASIEFCQPGAGGGKSSRTRVALIALMVAIEADNADTPALDWWARRREGAKP